MTREKLTNEVRFPRARSTREKNIFAAFGESPPGPLLTAGETEGEAAVEILVIIMRWRTLPLSDIRRSAVGWRF